MKKTEMIKRALVKCGYKESIEELMLFGEFKSGVRPVVRVTFGANSDLDEQGFLTAIDNLPVNSWGRIWLADETFFIFDGFDWEHIDCKVPEDIDPDKTFLR